MAKFITFNGTKFFNVENVASIEVKTHERVSNVEDERREYLYFTVEIDNIEVFKSEDFKTYEGKHNTPYGHKSFQKAYNYAIQVISN